MEVRLESCVSTKAASYTDMTANRGCGVVRKLVALVLEWKVKLKKVHLNKFQRQTESRR